MGGAAPQQLAESPPLFVSSWQTSLQPLSLWCRARDGVSRRAATHASCLPHPHFPSCRGTGQKKSNLQHRKTPSLKAKKRLVNTFWVCPTSRCRDFLPNREELPFLLLSTGLAALWLSAQHSSGHYSVNVFPLWENAVWFGLYCFSKTLHATCLLDLCCMLHQCFQRSVHNGFEVPFLNSKN